MDKSDLVYFIAKANVEYKRVYKKYINGEDIYISEYQNDYLINISNILCDYYKEFQTKYNEIEKKITVPINDKQKLFISVDKEFLLFEYNNKKYIVRDCHIFLELLRIFTKYAKQN